MTRRIEPKTFSSGDTMIVRRPFRAAGKLWPKGTIFPWRQLSVSADKARRMFESGHLRAQAVEEDQVDDTTPVQDTTPAPAVQTTTEDPNADLDVDNLVVLRAIAEREGASLKSSKVAQRDAIIAHRNGEAE
jgi:hypothetical protein